MDLALGPAGQVGGPGRGAGPAPGRLSPAPLVRRDGGRLRVRRGADAGAPAAVAGHAGARDGPHRAVCAPPRLERLRRPEPLEVLRFGGPDAALVPQLPEIPALIAVRADGPGAGTDLPGGVPRPARGPPGRSRLLGRWAPPG